MAKQTGNFVYVLITSFEVVFTAKIIVDNIASIVTPPSIHVWLNKWNDLDKRIAVPCGNMAPWRTIGQSVFLPAAICGSLLTIAYYFPDRILFTVFTVIFATSSIIANFGEDAKCIILFRSIEDAFSRIKLRISSNLSPSVSEIKEWHQILIDIRSQAESCGKMLAFGQLVSFLTAIYISASASFTIVTFLQNAKTAEKFWQLCVLSAFAVLSLGRTLYKIRKAVRVTEEVHLLPLQKIALNVN